MIFMKLSFKQLEPHNSQVIMSCISKCIGTIRSMETRRIIEPFCGDAVDSLAHQDKEFNWLVAYQWFLSLTPKNNLKNDIWIIGQVNVGYMPEVFDCRELVSWCAHRFDSKSRMIRVAIFKGFFLTGISLNTQ
jgi:hypothetical protein